VVRAAFGPCTVDRRTVDRTSTDVLDAEILVADREYFFCSLGCKREFERKPTAYAVAGRSEP
jgi:YHS domain-containing protein